MNKFYGIEEISTEGALWFVESWRIDCETHSIVAPYRDTLTVRSLDGALRWIALQTPFDIGEFMVAYCELDNTTVWILANANTINKDGGFKFEDHKIYKKIEKGDNVKSIVAIDWSI